MKFVFIFLLAGFVLPVFFLLALNFHVKFLPFEVNNTNFEDVMIILWPSSLMLMGETYFAAIVAIVTNVILYGTIGVLTWIGIYREKRAFFALSCVVICLIIYWVKIGLP